MNFFESQDLARRNTKLLLFLFALAVLSLIVLTNLLVFILINAQDSASVATRQFHYSWDVFLAIAVGVILLVVLASFFRMHSLKQGGSAVAEMMDGELLLDAGGDLNKEKLLNVVEEMAIASGTPVPPVYLIRDSAINAFAAGYSPGDAVIGITYGAIENLSRDELQGVIAHEFSHILNGDMRLNIKLIGVLYGILMLAIVGRILLSSGSHRGGRNREGGSIAMFGLGLIVVGYLGQFFGSLIKAAVSRQREFLADASAVQFTRDPSGIAGALKRIGGYSPGTVMQHPESEEISHAFFCEGVKFSLAGFMATHPPLDKRIQRLDPKWDGGYFEGKPTQQTSHTSETAMGFAAAGIDATINADVAVESIGNPGESQITRAREIIASMPAALMTAAKAPYSARALVYYMLLDEAEEVRQAQLKHLEEAADLGVFNALETLLAQETSFDPALRLPLLEIALPTLHQLSYEQYKLFISNLDVLIKADGRIGLSEWAVLKMVNKHLGEVFEGNHSKVRHNSLKQVAEHCEALLSMLAYSDRHASISPEKAFEAGREQLGLDISLKEKNTLGFRSLDAALDELAALNPLRKPKLLKACIRTVTADGIISIVEQELLRTVADTLECPMPPVIQAD